MKQKKCFAILLLCALTAFHILWDRQFSSTDSSDFVPVLPEPVIQINAMEQTPNPLILHASYACLMDAGSHRILYSKNTDKKVPMASTTKIMTALLALESNKLNDVVIASKKAAGMPKVHLGMQPGRQYYMKDLLYSLMLESHNDTAVAIAEHLGGSVSGFAAKMNQKAKLLGMSSTHFITPNGLDANGHYSTASDMCKLASYAIKNKDFLSLVQTKSHSFSDCSGKYHYSLTNHDAFLSYYEGALGIKTGFTGKAGYCYVGALTKGEKSFTIALLACGWPNNRTWKWHDARLLLEYGLEAFDQRSLQQPDLPKTLLVENGQLAKVSLNCPKKEIRMLLSRGDQTDVRVSLPGQLTAPVEAGEQVGTVSYLVNGALYEQLPVTAAFGVPKITYCYCLKRLLALVLL